MKENKSPAFQFYAENFLGGTAEMTAEEVGVYIRLLCHQWHKNGLPNDDKKLIQLSGGKKKAIEEVRKKFKVSDDGLLRNERLELTRQQQDDYREKRRKNAEARWSKSKCETDATASNLHEVSTCETDALHSSSSSSSSKVNTENTVADKSASPKNKKQEHPVQLPWESEKFKQIWEVWKKYRWGEKRQKFKSQESELAQLKHLHDLSAGEEELAIAIIEQSIGNTWTGLFQLKNLPKNGNQIAKQNNLSGTPIWRKEIENIG